MKELDKLEEMAKKKKKKGQRAKARKGKITAIADDQILRTQREAATYASVSARTIRNWVNEGMLTAQQDGKTVFIKSQLDFFKRNAGKQQTEAKTKGQTADAKYKEVRAELLQRSLDKEDGLIEKRAEEMIIPKILAMKRGVLSLERTIPAVVPKEHQRQVRKAVRREVRFMIKSLFNL